MKFLIVFLSAVALSTAAVTPAPYVGIVRQTSDINPDGSYQYGYEAENGINVEETGRPSNLPENPVVSTGSFKYTGTDGVPYSIQYVADENGFQPQGAHLPVAPEAPPIPAYIARALDWIAAHPAPPEKSF
ncbi:hypothetical protein Trydic_g22311 [Trypoxylus dichotomus]